MEADFLYRYEDGGKSIILSPQNERATRALSIFVRQPDGSVGFYTEGEDFEPWGLFGDGRVGHDPGPFAFSYEPAPDTALILEPPEEEQKEPDFLPEEEDYVDSFPFPDENNPGAELIVQLTRDGFVEFPPESQWNLADLDKIRDWLFVNTPGWYLKEDRN